MKTEVKNLLGFNVPVVGIAETLAEAVTAAQSEEAVLKDFNSNVLAHSHYTILRRVIAKTLVQLSGIKFKTVKDGDKDVIDETEGEYVARLESEVGEDVFKSYEQAVSDACAKVPVDYVPGTRGSGDGAKPAAKWLAYYDQLKAENKLDAFCSKHSIVADTEDELKVAVANKVKAIVTAKMTEAAKTALN